MDLKELGYEDAVKPGIWPTGSVHSDCDKYDDESPGSIMEYYDLFFLLSFFFFQCHHMSFVDFVVLSSGHGRSVTDF